MATNRSPIVGVFDDQAQAEKAIEELYNAGVSNDRISYSGRDNDTSTGTSFVDSLKNLFGGSGAHHRSDAVENDLERMGISQEEAQYYAQEYEAGRTIIAVQADEQAVNMMNILRSNGAHDFSSRSNYEKIGGYTQGGQDMSASQPSADTSAQRTDDASANMPTGRDTGTYSGATSASSSYNQPDNTLGTPSSASSQPASSYDQSAAALNQGSLGGNQTFSGGNQPASSYDQSTIDRSAATGNQTASGYDQSAASLNQGSLGGNQTSSSYDQSSMRGNQPVSSYDQSAMTGNQPASSYDQGSTANQQQTDYNRNANMGGQPSSGYDQGAAFADTPSTQQPGYGNAPLKDQPASAYDQSAQTSASGYRQEPGFTQAPNQQDYTTPDTYQQTMGQTGSQTSTDPNAYGQQRQSWQDPNNPNVNTYGKGAMGTTGRSQETASQGNIAGNYGQNADPNMYRDPNAGTYTDPNAPGAANRSADPDMYGKNADTTDTNNPLKKIVQRMKGETDPDADYNRESRNTDPDQNI